MQQLNKLINTLIALALVTLFGCGGTEYTYVPEPDEMQTGPGLISGEDGTFTVYNGAKKEKKEDKQDKE